MLAREYRLEDCMNYMVEVAVTTQEERPNQQFIDYLHKVTNQTDKKKGGKNNEVQ